MKEMAVSRRAIKDAGSREGPVLDSSYYQSRSPSPIKTSDLAILIMGVTGSGKSTFISRLTEANVGIGHSLESCTAEVEGYTIKGPRGENIYLIDTPGFDDTQISDVDLLQKIASTLEAMYRKDDIRFAGLIYMHRITDQRVAGSSLKSLRIFEKLCGEENYPCVILVTTMWNLLSDADQRGMGEQRLDTLKSKEEFFGKMVAGGAKSMRDDGTLKSAHEIIGRIAQQKSRVITALQRELADVGRTLEETAVGAFLREHLEQARQRFERERAELEEALEEARRDQDDDLVSTISDQCRELDERLRRTVVDEAGLSATQQDLSTFGTEWCRRLQMEAERSQQDVRRCQLQMLALEEELRKREYEHEYEMKLAKKKAKGDRRATEKDLSRYEKEMRALQEELARSREESAAKEAYLHKSRNRKGFWSKFFEFWDPDAEEKTENKLRLQSGSYTMNLMRSQRSSSGHNVDPTIERVSRRLKKSMRFPTHVSDQSYFDMQRHPGETTHRYESAHGVHESRIRTEPMPRRTGTWHGDDYHSASVEVSISQGPARRITPPLPYYRRV
ncbi:hypothetical protein M011DRAFT_459693 [Sporormia fimetaria CBS 119925]|uniref:G domain-containing protein n=1 Tax=Sporormia fimetaria CBS 119925 TaxID=1340428 RepID=A0A6A6V5L8_9PLEO|nr:hypothetical protein M011DRAFT_459693 [Sporormia fimetaria CBS 119925]